MIWGKKSSIVVIPPWLESREVWLAPAFDPQAWEQRMFERGIELPVYSYDQEAVQVRRCSLGGGLVMVNSVDKPWVMLALMNRVDSNRKPRGVPNGIDVGVTVVIPTVRAGSRLGFEPMPKAPGSLISVESPQEPNFTGAAFVSKKPIDEEGLLLIQHVFADYGLQAKPCDKVAIEHDFAGFLERKKMRAVYFELQNETASAKELYAITCLAGLLLRASFKSLFSVHLVAKIEGMPSGLRYAAQWSPGAKPPERAEDW